jgi:single-strand DNA-binding protein
MNQGQFIGHLGRDPEMKYLPDGKAVTNFSIGVTCYNKETLWVRVSVFGTRAENCNKYLSKGSQVFVQGEVKISQWTDKEGNARATLELTAREVKFLSSRTGDNDNGNWEAAGPDVGDGENHPF